MNKTNEYYTQANDWGYDLYESNQKWRGRFFIIAFISLLVAFASVIAVASLTPLKTTVLKIVEVNTINGTVSNVLEKDLTQYKATEPLVEMFIAKYLRECEGFDHKHKDEWLRNCQLFSGEEVKKKYLDFMLTNPRSPNIILVKREKEAESDIREVFINDFIHVKNQSVLVEFQTTDHIKGKRPTTLRWAAVIDYAFGKTINDKEESDYRYINPLGFHVTKFRKDQKQIKAR